MTKWLTLFLLLGVVAAVGCSQSSSKGPQVGSHREVSSTTNVDAAAEKAAMNPAGVKPAASKK